MFLIWKILIIIDEICCDIFIVFCAWQIILNLPVISLIMSNLYLIIQSLKCASVVLLCDILAGFCSQLHIFIHARFSLTCDGYYPENNTCQDILRSWISFRDRLLFISASAWILLLVNHFKLSSRFEGLCLLRPYISSWKYAECPVSSQKFETFCLSFFFWLVPNQTSQPFSGLDYRWAKFWYTIIWKFGPLKFQNNVIWRFHKSLHFVYILVLNFFLPHITFTWIYIQVCVGKIFQKKKRVQNSAHLSEFRFHWNLS